MPQRLWRAAKWLGIGLAGLIVVSLIPILWIETRCIGRPDADLEPAPSVLAKADRRDEINTYLTYPEWSIVHAYEDLAAVARRSSETDYPYVRGIARYWSSLCSITQMSSKRGVISTEYKAMLYIIGVSFSAEWGIKGLYENTIGRVTALIRGSTKTAEDEFAIKAWDEYNVFLQNAPWFEHAFGRQLGQFWRETSLVKGNPIRKLERRFAFSLEWGVKTIYARLIGAGAAATMPGAAKVRSVVADLDASDVAADPRIAIIKKLDTGHTIIETDRYQTLTEILQGLAVRGRNMSEIAGNTHILVTVQGPPGAAFASKEATVLLTVPVLVKDGWQRAAVDVKVSDLTEFLRKLKTSNIVLEHIYDY